MVFMLTTMSVNDFKFTINRIVHVKRYGRKRRFYVTEIHIKEVIQARKMEEMFVDD